jgi:C4-dicarboxylate-specific signal transduction histidine kinase
LILAIAGTVIIIITLLYSNYLSLNLAKNEEKNARLYAIALQNMYEIQDLDASFKLESEITQNNAIPIIVESETGELLGSNFGESRDNDQEYLRSVIEKLEENGFEPLKGDGYAKKIYYTRTRLYDLIKYYPYIQMLMVVSFITFGYLAFGRSRKAEQNRVWAGMAKETAHQLGTPISAILAWLENLKLTTDGNEMQNEIIKELEHDVSRLELVADRFSKIGSKPELIDTNVIEVLDEIKVYMKRRSPRRMEFDFPDLTSNAILAPLNRHLFTWVMENLIRNALDSMGSDGKITAVITEDEEMINIDLSDTGKGIPSNKFKIVFQPGYSTKKRGWGLGLSLVKRIIENYHNGKIFVKKSKINEGTTFTIRLPKTA